ncbi:MAG: hypothetical protein U1F10_16970 [Burkholderiales bacterium]
MNNIRKFAVPTLLLVLVVFAWIGTSVSPLREHSIDASAQRYVDEGLKRALVTFATARTINAVLSTVQGTTLAFEPLGVGVQLSVGQVLHPLNQIIGQFADWMLAASVAFGVMEVMVRIGSAWPLTLALTVAAGTWIAWKSQRGTPPAWLGRSLLLLAMLRFAIPFVSLGSEWAYAAFLSDEYRNSQAVLSASAQKVEGDTPPPADAAGAPQPQGAKPAAGGILGWLTSKLASSPAPEAKPEPGILDRWKSEATAKIASLTRAAESMTEHVIKLMAVFLLQTLIFPLALLWLMIGIGRRVLRRLHHAPVRQPT